MIACGIAAGSASSLFRAFVFLTLAAPLLAGCGYNTIPTNEERARAAWSEVLNQYQRRADLVPNLVETVKAFAAQEREVLTAVVEARAATTSIQVSPEMLDNPEALNQLDDHLVEI